jgi:HrpA-like RNA helicase
VSQDRDTIAMVRERLLELPGSRALMLLPLHSQLPAREQRAAFTQPPVGVRKVHFVAAAFSHIGASTVTIMTAFT